MVTVYFLFVLLKSSFVFADVPWKNVEDTSSVCLTFGSTSKQCVSATGVPIVLGKRECLAQKDGNTGGTYDYFLRWGINPGDETYIYLGETKLTLPRPAQHGLAALVWVKPRFSSTTHSKPETSPGHYVLNFQNTLTDIPEVVVGLPASASLDISVDMNNQPIGADILGIKFKCISTAE